MRNRINLITAIVLLLSGSIASAMDQCGVYVSQGLLKGDGKGAVRLLVNPGTRSEIQIRVSELNLESLGVPSRVLNAEVELLIEGDCAFVCRARALKAPKLLEPWARTKSQAPSAEPVRVDKACLNEARVS